MRDMQRRLSSLHQLCPDLNNPQAGQQIYNWWQQWRIEPIGFGNTAKKTGIQHTQKMKSPRTQNHGLSEVKTLVNWAWRSRALTGMRFELDLSFINPVRLEKKLKAQFTIDELAMGLRLHDHPYRVRFALYVYLGARRSEILQLKWSDIEGGMVKLRGKGMKERLTPMQSELATILRVHRRNGAERDGFIFGPSIRCDDGGNLTKRFNSFLKAAGIEKADRTTHSLRHCYAGLMAATGEPTALLQAYMGHSDSEMTTHYAQMAARYRSAVVEWPRGMLKILSTPLKSR
jgi:integrase